MSHSPTAQCPSCGSQFAITNQALIGRSAPCPHCRQPFLVQPIPLTPVSVGTLHSPQATSRDWMQPSQPANRRSQRQRANLALPLTLIGIGLFFLLSSIGGVIWLAMRHSASREEENVAQANDNETASGVPKIMSGESSPNNDDVYKPDAVNPKDSTDEHARETQTPPGSNYSNDPHSEPPRALPRQALRQDTSSTPPRATIRLSDAVVLPQTLPTGTAMTFSVAYEFTSGSPQSSNRYLWVISNRNGQSVDIPVQLQATGKLPWAAIAWQKHEGPFKCSIEELSPQSSRRALCSAATFR